MAAHNILFRTVPSVAPAPDRAGSAVQTDHHKPAAMHPAWAVDPDDCARTTPVAVYSAGTVISEPWQWSLPPVAMPAQLFTCLVERAYRQLVRGEASRALRTLEHALECGGRPAVQHVHALAGGQPVLTVPPAAVQERRRTPDDSRPGINQRIQVRTLGRFEVLVDGTNADCGRKHPKRTLALLQALIAFGGRQVSRITLTDALWPDSDGDQAHNALEAALHRLRGRLAVSGAIVSQHGCLDLDPQHVWVDALAFDAATATNPHQAGSIDCSAHVEQAFELYRGAFLPEDGQSWWTVRSRERLRSRFVGVVAAAAAGMEACKRFDAAAQLYERAIWVDDVVCVFHEGLIRCLQQLGRDPEARAALHRKQHLVTTSSRAHA